MEKPNMNQGYDGYIRGALRFKAEEVIPSRGLFDRINMEISDKEREYYTMNTITKIKRVKPLLIAVLILVLTAATSFAATQISSLVSTSSNAFDKFPTAHQVEKAVQYTPDYVKSFSNGFFFKNATISNTQALDNDNNKVDGGKGISFFYTREGAEKGQYVSLNTDREFQGLVGDLGPNEEEILCGDVKLTYSNVTYKLVPEGYVPTAEEKQKMDQGVLWISDGSDEITTSNLQYASWIKDGIVYNLSDNGFGIDKEEFLGMVKEIIK